MKISSWIGVWRPFKNGLGCETLTHKQLSFYPLLSNPNYKKKRKERIAIDNPNFSLPTTLSQPRSTHHTAIISHWPYDLGLHFGITSSSSSSMLLAIKHRTIGNNTTMISPAQSISSAITFATSLLALAFRPSSVPECCHPSTSPTAIQDCCRPRRRVVSHHLRRLLLFSLGCQLAARLCSCLVPSTSSAQSCARPWPARA